ncbi:hypothetical protein CEXT_673141 [Caerostris extrusa]|uniref:Uncharacterized protein n=1 Tax=Caerostris extrusa TaxID=172846 RepID=A0AAV4UK37_CAEEX|nr:hypothetical protein CEXT_673141 [Caerostris extrusa]
MNIFSLDGKSDENLWTPQFLSNSNKYSSALSADMEIPLELMDYPFPSQPTTYSLQPSPTTQNTNAIFNCNTELMNLGRSEYMEEKAYYKVLQPLESNVPEVSEISSSSFPYEYEQYSNTNFHQTFSSYPFYSSSPSLDNMANNIYPYVESPSSSEVSSVDYGHLQMYKDDGSILITGDELTDQFNDEDSGISDMEDLTDYANKLLMTFQRNITRWKK